MAAKQPLRGEPPTVESPVDTDETLLRKVARLERELARARHLASHDALTGLPNRSLMLGRLGQAMLQATRQNKMVAVLLLDLDGFKTVNDRFGHNAGDLLLRRVAGRLLSCIRGCDTACRYGGDEFVVLLPQIDRAEDADTVVRKVRACLALPHPVGAMQITVSASIGVGLYRQGASSCDALIQMADKAMHQAKARAAAPVAP